MNQIKFISARGVRVHNLKSVDVDIPHNKITVITGPSGSGKSSLAFDTIYAEGQRRYVESLSGYARQFIANYGKPDLDSISGLSPAIAIDQKTTSRNVRSTVGTMTEIYDYIRVMFARIGVPYSSSTNKPIIRNNISSIIQSITSLPSGTKVRICAPVVRNTAGVAQEKIIELQRRGFAKIKINGKLADLSLMPKLSPIQPYNIEVIIDRIMISDDSKARIASSVENAMTISGYSVDVDIVELPSGIESWEMKEVDQVAKVGETNRLSSALICKESGMYIEKCEPRLFSFNSPYGACKSCNGLGKEISFRKSLIVPDTTKSLTDGAIEPWHRRNSRYYLQILKGLAKRMDFSLNEPFEDLKQEVKDVLFNGLPNEVISISFTEGYDVGKSKIKFIGIIADLQNSEDDDEDDVYGVARYRDYIPCNVCNGYRLKKESLCFKIDNKNIGEVCFMFIDELLEWFKQLSGRLSKNQLLIADQLITEVMAKLSFLLNVGLDYLTLLRETRTLSGGESQRIRLASQIGSGLCGVVYVLDEPSIGLHSADNNKLINSLKRLRDLQNTVIVVEHDSDTIMAADYIIDTGPKAGKDGGYIIAHGSVDEIMNNPKSITGRFLSGKEVIEMPKAERGFCRKRYLELIGARANNLKNVHLKIPLGTFTVITGVSGGGKSTLIIDTLYKALSNKINGSSRLTGAYSELLGWESVSRVIEIDQSPIGRTPRSNPATYTGLFVLVRDWFAALPESRMRGYKSSRFSFNVKGGRCENCKGDGVIKVEMVLLPDVYVQCDVCKGKRYSKETLEIKSDGKNIADVLSMMVSDALVFFKNIPTIKEKLICLERVGLGYIEIGQSSTTVSGGEAQRVKLSRELSKKTLGDAVYILDEPTTGLHSVDIRRLIKVLQDLVDKGNTVLVIEHNLDVVKVADYVVDIGPVGGKRGGEIVAQGTPREVMENKNSVTGPFLKSVIERTKLVQAKKEKKQ
ncbi:MAG: excinuclease ABC subunit UvrA [Alphaproteobacteria bacterium]|nr:excinuclease ABC subunit UvrA [Rickettsiales bacterium]